MYHIQPALCSVSVTSPAAREGRGLLEEGWIRQRLRHIPSLCPGVLWDNAVPRHSRKSWKHRLGSNPSDGFCPLHPYSLRKLFSAQTSPCLASFQLRRGWQRSSFAPGCPAGSDGAARRSCRSRQTPSLCTEKKVSVKLNSRQRDTNFPPRGTEGLFQRVAAASASLGDKAPTHEGRILSRRRS